MHFEANGADHGLRFNPFKALVTPRPIGWISTVSRDGVRNLAPYSFFNAVSDRPPMVVFSCAGDKDTLRNVRDSGEFTCSIVTWALRDAMNLSSAALASDVDEFTLAGLEAAESVYVRAPRVAASPAALECRHWQTIELPGPASQPGARDALYSLVIGTVVGIYIDEAIIRDGLVDVAAMQPLARLGYMEYGAIAAESVFTMNRPSVDADGRSARVTGAPWDGVYR